MERRAFITGITGQDGSYLAEFLLSKGYTVYGLVRRSSNDPFVRLRHLKDRVRFLYGNLRDTGSLERAIAGARPHEVYNLAAQSDVGISFACPEETEEVNYYGAGRLINAALGFDPKIRIYQASTSEMFGKTKPPQHEKSPFRPVSPYGRAKLKAHEDFVLGYRKAHGAYICSGILFNHESPRRGEHFVTRKITVSLAKIRLGLQGALLLGNLDAKRDWGFAGDYVEAMWLMLQQKHPTDFVIATGESHTVRDFVNEAAHAIGMRLFWHGTGLREVAKDDSGKVVVRVEKRFYRPVEVNSLLGDSSRARRVLGWKPRVTFAGLAKLMAEADFASLSRGVTI